MARAMIEQSCLTNRADPPDCAIPVFAEEQAPIPGHRQPDWSTPDISIWRDETSHEVFVFAARLSILKRDPNDLVTGRSSAIPGAVEGGKNITAIFRGKLFPVVKAEIKRRGMR